MHRTLVGGSALAAALLVANVAQAGPFGLNKLITNFTFDNDATGAPPPTTLPDDANYPDNIDDYPQDVVYSISAYPSGTNAGGSQLVQDTGALNNALVLTGTPAASGAGTVAGSWVDTQFGTGSNYAVMDFDLHVIQLADDPSPQGDNLDFNINTFGGSNPDVVFRFGVAHTGDDTFVLGTRTSAATGGQLTTFASGTEGDSFHVRVFMDWVTQTVDFYVNDMNTPALANHPFIVPGQTFDLAEYFIYANSPAAGDEANIVAIDNIVTFVPEPGSLALLGLGGLAALSRRRRA